MAIEHYRVAPDLTVSKISQDLKLQIQLELGSDTVEI